MSKKYSVIDTWNVAGNDHDELRQILDEVFANTRVENVPTYAVRFITPCIEDDARIQVAVSGTGTYDAAPSAMFETGLPFRSNLNKEALEKSGLLTSEAYQEMERNHTGFLLVGEKDPKLFLWSPNLLDTLEQRVKLVNEDNVQSGRLSFRYFGENPTMRKARDLAYASLLNGDDGKVCILYRHDPDEKSVRKAFAAFGSRYGVQSQSHTYNLTKEIFEKEMGRSDVTFVVSNYMTDIILTFPEKAADICRTFKMPEVMTPCVHLLMDDTGHVSTTTQGGFMKNGHLLLMKSAFDKRMHTKVATPPDTVEKAAKKIFAEYTRVPQALMNLSLLDIDPNKINDCIKGVAQQIGLDKRPFNKDVMDQAVEMLTASINQQVPYTAYDICNLFLDLPETLKFEEKEKKADGTTGVTSLSFEKKWASVLDLDAARAVILDAVFADYSKYCVNP